MSIQARPLRALLGLSTALSLAAPAIAQTAPPAPPARVGQIAAIAGSVSYNGAASNGDWIAATRNYPLTTGDALYTQSGAEAAIALDASRLTLGPLTELQITALDDQDFTATETQGEIFLHLTALAPGQTFTIDTPRGSVTVTQAAELDIAAGGADQPTTVAVLAGSAQVAGTLISGGQEAQLTGTSPVSASVVPVQRDAFMAHVLAEMAPPPPPYAPPAVSQMTGIYELSAYGSWDQSSEYGAVWYPNVGPGWAPFREGHWAYIAPWGWTWVDNAPWGFAPFHYGRWIEHGGRWGWVPVAYAGGYVESAPPVYAPAVVSFFGLGAGVAISAAILSSGSVGWVPLAPGEAYYPPYHASPEYLQRVNRIEVRNYQNLHVDNHVTINNYANLRGATYIQAAQMAHGDPVGHVGHPVPPAMFEHARPVPADFNQALRPQITHREAPAPHLSDFARAHAAPMQGQPAQAGRGPAEHPGMAPAMAAHEMAPHEMARPLQAEPPHAAAQAMGPHAETPHAPPGAAMHEMARPEMARPAPEAAPHAMARPEPRVEAPREMARPEPREAPREVARPEPREAQREMARPEPREAPREMARPEAHAAPPRPAPHPEGGRPDQPDHHP